MTHETCSVEAESFAPKPYSRGEVEAMGVLAAQARVDIAARLRHAHQRGGRRRCTRSPLADRFSEIGFGRDRQPRVVDRLVHQRHPLLMRPRGTRRRAPLSTLFALVRAAFG
ncbi:hypothetical protein [Nocardia sp. NPDC059228]|uniref:hypothetical protein n=1 Tax=Nocardia sp. NPDC059228 TaxID=3346777 RepID=UPI0036AE65B6